MDLGPYELRGMLGRGGMGEVHRAFDHEQRRMVALKILPAEISADPTFVERFRRESFAAAQLTDPHVVPIHRYGELDGRLYLDMRLVDGLDLAELLRRDGPLEPHRATSFIAQAAEALDAAHAAGLVHRDVKPSNLLVTAQGFVYLVDFGIAQLVGTQRGRSGLTSTGTAVGTLAYMAPERFDGGRIGPAADVYSLACVLYEVLVGRGPFPFDEPAPLIRAHLGTAPPQASDARFDLPPALDDVIARGMAKDPAQRYATAGAFADDARRAVSGTPAGAVPGGELHRVARSGLLDQPRAAPRRSVRRRTRTGPRVLVALTLALVLVTSVLFARSRDTDGASAGAPPTAGPAPTATAPTPLPPTTTPTTGPTTGPTTAPTTGPTTAESTTDSSPSTGSTRRGPGDLGLSDPISNPPCEGGYVVFVGSTLTPEFYASTVGRLLRAYPGSSYLWKGASCASLRSSAGGNAIYSVYLGPFLSQADACAALSSGPDDAYIRVLSNSTPPGRAVTC